MDRDNNKQSLRKGAVKSVGHQVADRITDDAVLRVIYEEEYRIKQLFRYSKMLARHAGRKTVQEEDVRLAYDLMRDMSPDEME